MFIAYNLDYSFRWRVVYSTDLAEQTRLSTLSIMNKKGILRQNIYARNTHMVITKTKQYRFT